MAIKAETCSL